MNKLKVLLFWWLTIPHVIAYLLSRQKNFLNSDIDRWIVCAQIPLKKYYDKDCHCILGGGKTLIVRVLSVVWLILAIPEFRNVFYLRFKYGKLFLSYLPRYSTLYICTPSEEFGPGVYIQHGFATVITADHIGRNCWINQQVTIGYNASKKYGYGRPWIGDNVRVSAGAKVCGKVKVGDGSIIGVNAVVVKDVPPNSTVVPSPMMLIRENGEKVYKKL